MPASQTAPDPHIQRLVDEGHEVTIGGGYLIVDRIPYLTSARQIAWGALICKYRNVDGVPQLDNDHQCWFTGSMPHRADGTPLEGPLVSDKQAQMIANRPVQMRFSNKPEPIGDFFDNHYNKVTHYIRKLSRHARDIDPAVSATSVGSYRRREVPSVFHYANDAIAQGGLDAITDKVRLRRVCIVGAGGTGSYLLDALAKEEIELIDLYDHDVIEPKNPFRMPGAMNREDAYAGHNKALWLASCYTAMRTGVTGHPLRIDADSVAELAGADFVFISVDHGPSRGIIARYLVEQRIPFIDAGIGVDKRADVAALIARARVTLVTPDTAHLVDELPTADDSADAVYNNIQVLEINALNAMLAVIRFKQYLGFYAADEHPDVIKYVSSWNALVLRGPSLG
ncbi:MAG: ThiF family adenylyltransferase [Betaproteobacteria bacterium]|nr:ThiF family adenylyltransferase [Betaproteobacteria bacterium]